MSHSSYQLHHPGVWQTNTADPQQINTIHTDSFGLVELTNESDHLAQLSQLGQWIVLINPPHINYKTILARAGVCMDRILLVHTKDEVEALWSMERALISGTASAVVCWTQQLDDKDCRRLQLLARSARAKGIILQTQPHSPHKSIPINTQLFSSIH